MITNVSIVLSTSIEAAEEKVKRADICDSGSSAAGEDRYSLLIGSYSYP